MLFSLHKIYPIFHIIFTLFNSLEILVAGGQGNIYLAGPAVCWLTDLVLYGNSLVPQGYQGHLALMGLMPAIQFWLFVLFTLPQPIFI